MQKFWWINLIRGMIALLIGILLLTWFQEAHKLFANFLAMYWLSSGLVGLRGVEATHLHKKWYLTLNIVEALIGAAILLRPLYEYLLAPKLDVTLFGLIAFCVGLIRLFSRNVGKHLTREQSFSVHLLGLFEAGLGLLLIFADAIEPYTQLLAGGWALLAGLLLILQSWQRRQANIAHS
jgi:uncharacterized membrane protein HdeD (DUF308 family)